MAVIRSLDWCKLVSKKFDRGSHVHTDFSHLSRIQHLRSMQRATIFLMRKKSAVNLWSDDETSILWFGLRAISHLGIFSAENRACAIV